MSRNRLAAPKGLFLDRDQSVDFSFDGKRYMGIEGDTITSALYANGVKTISRSFKYHRPRATLSAAGHDANGLVQVGDEPNVNADVEPIRQGMAVTPQNVVGSLDNDRAQMLDKMGRFMPVGFYYKAFYKP